MELSVNNLNMQAYSMLKEKILNKEFPHGMRFVDSQLAREYGISRTPLRDAIRKLTEEGLLVNKSKRGFYLFQPTVQDIEEIFALREILDIAAATILINEILPKDKTTFNKLRISFEKYCELMNKGVSFVKDDENFHDAIVILTGNSRMMAWYTELRNQTRAFRGITSSYQDRMQIAQEYHKKIYQGLMEMDLEKTIEAIKKHVYYSKRDALKDFLPKS